MKYMMLLFLIACSTEHITPATVGQATFGGSAPSKAIQSAAREICPGFGKLEFKAHPDGWETSCEGRRVICDAAHETCTEAR